jgi:hypothetical protein
MERTTAFLVLAVVLLLSVYDVIVAIWSRPESTISGVLLDAAKEYPIVPFAICVLTGHIWGEHRALHELRSILQANLWVVILAGLAAGALLWPNR